MRAKYRSGIIVYPRYLRTWRDSRARAEMNASQRGLYWELIDHSWEHGSLPNDKEALRRIANVSDKEFASAWPVVSQWFYESEGRLFHKKVVQERPSLLQRLDQRIEAGKNRAVHGSRNQGGRYLLSTEIGSGRSIESTTDSPSALPTELATAVTNKPTTETASELARDRPPTVPEAVQHARAINIPEDLRAGPSGLSTLDPPPSVGSHLPAADFLPAADPSGIENNAELKSAPPSGGKAPGHRSETTQEIATPQRRKKAKILGYDHTQVRVEVEGPNGHEIRSMTHAEVEALETGEAQS